MANTSKANTAEADDGTSSKSYIVRTPHNPGYRGALGKVRFVDGEAVVPQDGFRRELDYMRASDGYEVVDNSGPDAKPVPELPEIGAVGVAPARIDQVVQPLIPTEDDLPRTGGRASKAKAPVKVATVEVNPGKDAEGKPAK